MADDKKTAFLRSQLKAYLQHIGVDPDHDFNCLNPDHKDDHPSMAYFAKKHIVYCRGCKVKYSVFDLVAMEAGLNTETDFAAVKAKVEQILFPTGLTGYDDLPAPAPQKGANPLSSKAVYLTTGCDPLPIDEGIQDSQRDFTKEYLIWQEAVDQTNYWEQRGITQDTIKRYRLGYNPKQKAVTIPCTPYYWTARRIDAELTGSPKYNNPPRPNKVDLFNEAALDQLQPVFITEGAINALSILQEGFQALAMNNSEPANLIRAIEKRDNLPTLILCLDPDKAGRETTQKLIDHFNVQNKRPNIRLFNANFPERYEDANSMLKLHKNDFRPLFNDFIEKALKDEHAEFYQNNVLHHLDNFIGQKISNVFCPTGFKDFDEYLHGGLHAGLVVLGAESGLGKTSFALQIANNNAAAGRPVLFFTMEQSINELIMKTISFHSESQLTFYDVLDVASGNFKTDDQYKVYEAAADKLYSYGKHLFVMEKTRPVKDIGKEIFRFAAVVGQPPLVIVDYLHKIPAPECQYDRRMGIDANIGLLKHLSVHYDIPVLVISSVNRTNYGCDITEAAFKESGEIEFTADLLLGLQWECLEKEKSGKSNPEFDNAGEKARSPRKVQIKVIKARSGEGGGRFNFDFDAAHSRFTPTTNNIKRGRLTPK